MRRIEEEIEDILIEIEDRLTFYNLNIAKRSFKPAIFRFSTICLALFLIITMSPLLTPNYTNSFLQTLLAQVSDNETAPPGIFVPPGDTIPPDIIVPDDITVEVTGPNGTPVEYAVTAEDNVDGTAILEQDGSTVTQDGVRGNITISCNPPSGFEFPIDNTAVECTATDASGNEGEGFFTITVQEAVVGPESTIDPLTVGIIANATIGEAPATFEFETNVAGGAQPYTFSWDFDGDGSEDSNEQSVVHTFDEPGTYNVTLAATDSSNQNVSDSIVINVGAAPPPPSPSVEIIPSSMVGITPATFNFEANVIGGSEPYSYSWDFDGDSHEDSNEETGEYTFEEAGIHNVVLTVTDSNGLTTSNDITITVERPNGWIILVVLASVAIGGIALGKYKMNRRSSRRIKIPPSALVEIKAKGGIDQ